MPDNGGGLDPFAGFGQPGPGAAIDAGRTAYGAVINSATVFPAEPNVRAWETA